MKLKKNAIGLAVAATIGFSGSANAIVEGVAGEALLVPFVLFDTLSTPGGINTIVEITVPSSVGADTVPNFFTAPNTTPTTVKDPAYADTAAYEENDPDLGFPGDYAANIHVYFFDEQSNERWNRAFPVSPDDFFLLNWGDMVARYVPALNGVKGYLVITNDKNEFPGDPNWRWTDAARFSMFGDAFMMWPTFFGLIDTKIPVLPMSDGDDRSTGPGARCPVANTPCVGNEVVHFSNGAIRAVSPLSAGMRIGVSDGDDVAGGGEADYTLFDLTMSNRFLPTLHVIWVDENIGQNNQGFVFNDIEESCSYPLPVTNELNVIWTSPYIDYLQDPDDDPDTNDSLIPPWVDAAVELCYPGGIVNIPVNPFTDPTFPFNGDIFYPGFARFQINEYRDSGIDQPESAGVAFSIQLQVDLISNDRTEVNLIPQVTPIETALGHERGTYQDRKSVV